MRPPKYDGGGLMGTWQAEPTNNFTALKKADQGRIKDVLRICNWLAAPFGTEEYLFRRFGTVGVHYNMQNGSPALTQSGTTQTALGVRYIVDGPDVLFVPGNPAATTAAYQYQKSIIDSSVRDPTVGVFSDTWSRKQSNLTKIVMDMQNDVLAGRRDLSAVDEAISRWKSEGGDEARREFQEQIEKYGES